MENSHEEELKTVRVKMDGETYPVRGRATEAYVRLLAGYVDQKIAEVRKVQPNLPRHRAAILAALNLADDLEKLKRENAELIEVLEEA